MASRTFEHVVRDVPALRAVDPAVDAAPRRRLRYRLAVAAPSAAEAVRLAGGWLFDHVIAGWDVIVLTARPGDDRALRIIGATPLDLETALSTPRRGARVDVVAAVASLYDEDERVRMRLRAAVDKGDVTDARLWDTREPLSAEDIGRRETYRPTTAARAFKAQALAAINARMTDDALTETFQSVPRARAYTTV